MKMPSDKDYSSLLNNILTSLDNLKTEDKNEDTAELELTNFRVSDALEPVTGYQYFGFIRPDGAWYILFNDVAEGKVRYKFGKKNYPESWDNCTEQDFKTIDEAINAIKD